MNRAFLHICGMLFLIFLTSCSNKEYYDIIPKSSPAVTKVNFAAFSEKSRLESFQSLLPFKKGVDYGNPAYMFVSPGHYYGIVMAVSDESEIEKAVQESKAFKYREESDGLNWVLWNDNWQVAWNDDAVLVIGPVAVTEFAFMKRTVSAMFNSEGGISSSKLYELVNGEDSAVSIAGYLSAMPSMLRAMLSSSASYDCDVDSLLVTSSVSFRDSCIHFDNKITRADGNEIDTSAESMPYAGTFSSKALSFVPCRLFTGICGEDLLKRLKADKVMKATMAAVNLDMDVDRIIKSMYGDAVIGINSIGSDGQISFSMSVKLSDKSFLDDVPKWQQNMRGKKNASLVRDADGSYTYLNGKTRFTFRVDSDILSFSYGGKHDALSTMPAQTFFRFNVPRNVLCYACFSCKALLQTPFVSSLHSTALSTFLSAYHDIIYMSTSACESTIDINAVPAVSLSPASESAKRGH